MTRYLTVVELIIINQELVGERSAQMVGSQLRDVDLLEAAVLRPQASAFGEDAYATIPHKAAALFHSLARNHAFVDGNKRTSTVAVILFLELNGYSVRWDDEQALDFILQVATGQHELDAITAWITANSHKNKSAKQARMIFLSAADIYHINEAVLGREPIVMNHRVLQAAATRPFARIFGQEAYPSLVEKAAALLHALAHDHPFVDGNKRTAQRAVTRFLEANDAHLTWTPQEAYDLILDIAKGRYHVDDVSDHLAPFIEFAG